MGKGGREGRGDRESGGGEGMEEGSQEEGGRGKEQKLKYSSLRLDPMPMAACCGGRQWQDHSYRQYNYSKGKGTKSHLHLAGGDAVVGAAEDIACKVADPQPKADRGVLRVPGIRHIVLRSGCCSPQEALHDRPGYSDKN